MVEPPQPQLMRIINACTSRTTTIGPGHTSKSHGASSPILLANINSIVNRDLCQWRRQQSWWQLMEEPCEYGGLRHPKPQINSRFPSLRVLLRAFVLSGNQETIIARCYSRFVMGAGQEGIASWGDFNYLIYLKYCNKKKIINGLQIFKFDIFNMNMNRVTPRDSST